MVTILHVPQHSNVTHPSTDLVHATRSSATKPKDVRLKLDIERHKSVQEKHQHFKNCFNSPGTNSMWSKLHSRTALLLMAEPFSCDSIATDTMNAQNKEDVTIQLGQWGRPSNPPTKPSEFLCTTTSPLI